MNIKHTLVTKVLALGLAIMAGSFAQAQMKPGTASDNPEKVVRRETLSGIDVYPASKENGFLLSFQQDLKEEGVLQFKDAMGKVTFAKSLPAGDYTYSRPIKLGLLTPGEYLVEVKTSNTVYWKKVRVRL